MTFTYVDPEHGFFVSVGYAETRVKSPYLRRNDLMAPLPLSGP